MKKTLEVGSERLFKKGLCFEATKAAGWSQFNGGINRTQQIGPVKFSDANEWVCWRAQVCVSATAADNFEFKQHTWSSADNCPITTVSFTRDLAGIGAELSARESEENGERIRLRFERWYQAGKCDQRGMRKN
jgi:hypothetical protein